MEDSKISVLIADDNKEFCSILNDYLLNQRDIVVTGIAKDGREALDLIVERKPDLVILDIIRCERLGKRWPIYYGGSCSWFGYFALPFGYWG